MPRHQCPAPDCVTMIQNRFAFCTTHWRQLDYHVQRDVTQSLKDNGAGSSDHIDTMLWAARTLHRDAPAQEVKPAGA